MKRQDALFQTNQGDRPVEKFVDTVTMTSDGQRMGLYLKICDGRSSAYVLFTRGLNFMPEAVDMRRIDMISPFLVFLMDNVSERTESCPKRLCLRIMQIFWQMLVQFPNVTNGIGVGLMFEVLEMNMYVSCYTLFEGLCIWHVLIKIGNLCPVATDISRI